MNAKYVALALGVAALVVGVAADLILLGAFGVLVVLFWLVMNGRERSSRRLQAVIRSASSGATRVETVREDDANGLVRRYTDAGWVMEAQSSAKSFGSRPRVTLTFRKP